MLNQTIVDELVELCERHRDAGVVFREAVKRQAEAHQLEASALGRYVRAKMNDKLDKLHREHQTLDQLEFLM